MQTADVRAMPLRKASSSRPAPTFRLPRVLLVPALLAIALSAAACSSSGPSSPASSAAALIAQGLNAESIGQTQQAVKDFENATAKDPASYIAYYDLGVMYQQNLNEPSLAANEYNKALLANPTYNPAMFNLAIVETPSDPQSAISLYNKLLARNPNDANVNFNLGLLLIAQKQVLQGDVYLKKAIAIDPSLAKRLPAGVTP